MIGTEKERALHAALKQYFEPDPAYHEIPCRGYIADILRNNTIVEIQTRSLGALRDKLKAFLPDYHVTVVHPIACEKTITVVDEETGGVLYTRRSPKKGKPLDAVRELYRIRPFLGDPNLDISLVLLNVEEYRQTDRKHKKSRRGFVRVERLPKEILSVLTLSSPADYRKTFLPDGLPDPFTVSDLRQKIGGTNSDCGTLMLILSSIGAAERIGKRGNAYLYRIPGDREDRDRIHVTV